jgi:hypothetical protein
MVLASTFLSFSTMLNLVALCAIALSLLTITAGAARPEDLTPASGGGVKVNLNPNSPDPGRVAAAWWAGWHPDLLPLDKVSWNKYTHMTYAFA